MWRVDQPSVEVVDTVNACASGLRDADLRARLRSAIKQLQRNNTRYRILADNDLCHMILDFDLSVSLTGEEMRWIYESRLVRSASGRRIYDAIARSAPYGLCCYCQYGISTTLDHFVPQATVPGLSIDPWNLVPACKDCNHNLGDFFSNDATQQLLHPYYVPDIGKWLWAELEAGPPVFLRFYAEPPQDLDKNLRMRILNQFKRLKLDVLYSTVSIPELVQIGLRAQRLPDMESRREHLQEMLITCAAISPNSFRAVTYETLAASDWYCAGGYAEA
jgi:5-methylcytosine-specific restriction endonuclease McrA